MIGSTAKPTLELPNQLTGMYSIPVLANPIKLMLVVLVAFEKSLWSRRMPPFLLLHTNRSVRFGFCGLDGIVSKLPVQNTILIALTFNHVLR